MNIILFDDPLIRTSLLPLTFTRPVAEVRIGILTIGEKWSRRMHSRTSFSTAEYLWEKFPLVSASENLWINGACCPDERLIDAIHKLEPESGLIQGSTILAARSAAANFPDQQKLRLHAYQYDVTLIDRPWKIFQKNAEEIQKDFDLITRDRSSEDITDSHTVIYGEQNIFVEEGATIRAAIINAETGPVYIGKNAMIHEGAIIRGSFVLGEGAQVSMGGLMRGDSTIGPYCRAGGEIANSVMFGYSNKSHAGYLGNSVIGEWCNLGADTNASNLKNNYAPVKIWNYKEKDFVETGQTFCGLVMGDHTKCGINTMFNTGSVVGVCANIFGAGFPPTYIPSFAWGGAQGFTTFQLDKAHEIITRVMARREIIYDDTEQKIMESVFKLTAEHRSWTMDN